MQATPDEEARETVDDARKEQSCEAQAKECQCRSCLDKREAKRTQECEADSKPRVIQKWHVIEQPPS